MRFTVAILITIIVCKCKASGVLNENEPENIQDNIEPVQMDNNCTATLSNLKINGSSEELNITWDGNMLCDFQYRITVEELSANGKNFGKTLNTTSYLYTDAKPCTKYTVIVELLQNDTETLLAPQSLLEKYETEPIAFNQIEKLNISTTTSAIWLSWKAHKYANVCKIRYIITANKEIPYFRYVNRTDHWIKNLHSCTEYNISVTPSSRLRSDFDDNIPLMHPITTLPETVNNLTLEVHNNSSKITWIPPPNYNKCIKEYTVTINGTVSETTNNTFIERSENLYCTDITIQAVNNNNASGKSVRILKPGPVTNLTTTTTESSFTATWELPENGFCVANYSVEFTGTDLNETIDTSSLTYTFKGLKPCSNFEIKVAARSIDNILGNYIPESNSTSEPQSLESVRNFNLNEKLVTWDPPLNTGACNITYVLKLHNNTGNEVFNDTTNETFLVIGYDSWIGCMNYTVSITPTLGSSQGKPQAKNISIPAKSKQPNCKEISVKKTSAVLECELDSYENNMCTINKIFINCEASLDDNEGSWIIWNATAIQNIADDSKRDPVSVTIGNMSEFTNYTCCAVIANSVGNSSVSEPVGLQTQEEVPGAPLFVNVTEIIIDPAKLQTMLYITWKKPEKVPGIQQNYSITIVSRGAQYFQPTHEFCTRKEQLVHIIRVEPSTEEYYFPLAFPKYKYEIYVIASTRAGFGEKSDTEVRITQPGVPDEPSNINFIVNNTTTIKDYDANVTLMWMFPCYTNGVLKHFEIDVLGFPYADLDKPNDTRNRIIVPIHENIQILEYEYLIGDLFPAFNYTIYIKTVIEDHLESQQHLTFPSPESYPEAPIFKPITAIKTNSFTLEWNAPAQKNGYILEYNLIVNTEDSLYWVPHDCTKNNGSYLFNPPPDDRSYLFNNATPYHNYTAHISASTSIGEGSKSEMLSTQTLPAEPKPVRYFAVNTTNSTTEEYNAEVLLSFKHPCDIYGSFKQFTIMLHGMRSNNTPHQENKTETAQKDKYEFSFKLFAEYAYVLMVQVETASHSTSSKMEFTSPSGVPPTVSKQIQAPVAHDSTRANFTFDCDLFDEKYGAIQYYALILGEDEKYGFWDGTNATWPVVGNSTNTYQATPIIWNPFLNASCYNYTFVLGDGSSEHNKPLQDGITYQLKVRGFTEFGYRDSPLISFLIPGVTNLALILGLVFGLLGTVILLGFIFILWRKRKHWEMKKESIKSIPLTPIPVAIKQFSQYYDELRTNSDRLKHEFTLLGSKSNELIQSSDDGITPENKKKNRYTNIIPYDETRVKLMDTNDNHSVTDYINASYIIGYSGTMEYIATQGPLEHTCMDFWKMVIQENSSLIVMVAQFVEQNKDKCYKYFPNNHENMELDNGIAIRCCTELDFKTHIVRTLLIQKDLQQWTVTHLQFTDWPDFGCPIGSEVILEFCQIMREHAERSSDPIVIHCSAGVGRTGTLIALDIVLQAISYKRDIDIFGTVLNLRRDRKSMVQTEKQYLYIHSCIKDAIENPPPIQCVDSISKEPVYENLEDINRSQSDNNIKESIF